MVHIYMLNCDLKAEYLVTGNLGNWNNKIENKFVLATGYYFSNLFVFTINGLPESFACSAGMCIFHFRIEYLTLSSAPVIFPWSPMPCHRQKVDTL